MSHRPLVFVSGLTLGDYLLWNWSLNANHDVLALVSGLTLPPLAVACLWLLAARCVARLDRSFEPPLASRSGRAVRARRTRRDRRGERSPGAASGAQRPGRRRSRARPTSRTDPRPPHRKLAA